MKFSCDKNILVQAVNAVIKILPAKSPMPLLEGILLETGENNLKLIGYDMEVGIDTCIEVEVQTPGKIVVNGKMFGDVLKNLDNNIIYISVDDKYNMSITCGLIKYVLPCLDAQAYPEMPVLENSKIFNIKQNIFLSMIRQTLFAVSTNDSRPILTGSLFDIGENSITVVSSDNFKMAIRREEYENPIKEAFSFIVPGKTQRELLNLVENNEDLMTIGLASRHIVFEFGTIRIISRLLDGEFLNYNAIIPRTFKTKTTVNIKEFKKTVERASVLISEKVKIPVRCDFEHDTIVLSCKSNDGHSFNDEIKSEIEGEPLEIGFNHKYLIDALNACEGESVLLALNSPVSSMCFLPEKGEKFVYLISPMRLRNDEVMS